ncbi:hypothetical protein FHETE_10326 [Fusarium heterosporum]|uniref:NAD-dependent epimerase/dehydratase domain-containing protein n=1 Tax=Fusarium heterosporum TaxID=42747 RepID=A0A8H5SPS6_FUSHE|nr:hypothetical protein FHETE_10326 [Fusarium heterosporum]
MVLVAVAGGAGGIGSAIADTLRLSPHHKLIIPTRKVSNTAQASDAFVTVNYGDTNSMVKVFDDNNVHTVISAILVNDSVSSEVESNLVRATNRDRTSKRFIASAWGIQYADTYVFLRDNLDDAESRTTNLEWTRFTNGFFLDYYGPPSCKSYMRRVAWSIDMVNKKAGIPGKVNEPMTFTYSFDVAKFVVAALDLPKWNELMYCYGEKTTWNEFLKQADEARGKRPQCLFVLPKGEVTVLPSNEDVPDFSNRVLEGLMSFWGLDVLEGKFDIPTDKALDHVFPDINPLKNLEGLSNQAK